MGCEFNVFVATAKRKESIQTTERLSSPFVLAAQRSAHELPLVEKQDMDGCSVLGGQQMILTGQNFSSDSKVVFMEKTQGGWPELSLPPTLPQVTDITQLLTRLLSSNY